MEKDDQDNNYHSIWDEAEFEDELPPPGQSRGIKLAIAGLVVVAIIGLLTWAVMVEIDRQEILQWAADQRPAIGSIMLFLYALSLWSLWFAGRGGGESGAGVLADLDFDSGELGGDNIAS